MSRALSLAALVLALVTASIQYPGLARADVVKPSTQSQAAITPRAALDLLKAGNERFANGQWLQRDYRVQVAATANGQYPFASVLGCIDSRVAPELVFDQGIGDLFDARIAGNFVNDDILGSLEFASKLSGSHLIVVLGHTNCGAIKGACDGARLGNLTQLLDKLKPAVDAIPDDGAPRTSKNHDFVQKVAEQNVRLTIEEIKRRSPVLREMGESGELLIVGAMYDIATGKVEFFE